MTLLVNVAAADTDDQFEAAREHLQKGRYAEAEEAYQELTGTDAHATRVAAGLARVYQEQGRLAEAGDALQSALRASPEQASLWAQLAQLQYLQGDYESASSSVDEALRRDRNHPQARLIRADIQTQTGRIELANEGYRWFIRYYNRVQPRDAETLLVVARGAVQYANWNRNTQIFRFVVNTLCPDALKDDETSWQSYLVAGSLFLEKYNRADGLPELDRALAINPRAAEVLCVLGQAAFEEYNLSEAEQYVQKALDVNPRLVAALRLKGDIALSQGRDDEAVAAFEAARAVNPHDQATLAGLAACYLTTDGVPPGRQLDELLSNLDAVDDVKVPKPTRFVELVRDLARVNPRPGYFLTALGGAMERQRQFDLAERLYKHALSAMPQLAEPKTALAMLYMRVGKTIEAKTLLEEAFQADPFHVRAANMRKVIGLLEGYETITTDHFVIRVDAASDRMLGRYMAEYLEEIYPEVVEKFGYEPQQRTQFEIFHDANGQSAHEWFSARMIGLPWIQTIGASTGMMVAMASPTAAERPFNWARVLKHEFVHIVTLQKTQFRIPHWLTEALAVASEGYPRPHVWNELLATRVPRGELRTLKTLNQGFAQSQSPLDLQFAYCQAKLYYDYLVDRYGEDSIGALLDAFTSGSTVDEAILRACHVDLETFERGYLDYLNQLVTTLPAPSAPAEHTLAELEQAYEADPDNPHTTAEYAEALMNSRRRRLARKLAEAVLEQDQRHPLACIILAQLELRSQDYEEAAKYLERALVRESPDRRVLTLLAKVKLLMDRPAEAAELCELGARSFPDSIELARGLAVARLRTDDAAGAATALLQLARLDADDADVRKRLARLAIEQQEFEDAARFAGWALHIDVLDPEVHTLLAEAALGDKKFDLAIREYEAARELSPDDNDVEISLARAYLAAERHDDARQVLESVLERSPEEPQAQELMKRLEADRK